MDVAVSSSDLHGSLSRSRLCARFRDTRRTCRVPDDELRLHDHEGVVWSLASLRYGIDPLTVELIIEMLDDAYALNGT